MSLGLYSPRGRKNGPRTLLVFASSLLIGFVLPRILLFSRVNFFIFFYFSSEEIFWKESLFMKETSCAIWAKKYLAVVSINVAFRAVPLLLGENRF